MPVTIVVASPKGGVGRTTLTAQLAARLTRAGKRSIAVDLDPQNGLTLHLGARSASQAGQQNGHKNGQSDTSQPLSFVNAELSSAALLSQLRALRLPVPFVPFGTTTARLRKKVEHEWVDSAQHLQARLDAIIPPRCEILLIDTPAGQNLYAESALGLADLILVPLLADPACAAALPTYEGYLRASAPQTADSRLLYVINQWNPTRKLSCDVLEVLRGCMRHKLFARPIFDDEALREQLARGKGSDTATISQASHDLDELVKLLTQTMAERSPANMRRRSA